MYTIGVKGKERKEPEMRLTSEAIIDNRDYDGDTVAVFEALARDEEGRECVAVWDSPER